MRPLSECLSASPWPSSVALRRPRSRAISGRTTTSAPPPSVTTQQSRRWSGSATIGDASTWSTVTGSRRKASGLCCACSEAATLISANWALVVPYSCMCRLAVERVLGGDRRSPQQLEVGFGRLAERPVAARRRPARARLAGERDEGDVALAGRDRGRRVPDVREVGRTAELRRVGVPTTQTRGTPPSTAARGRALRRRRSRRRRRPG